MGLSLDRPGASPLVHLSLMSFPLTDPGFFAVRATVLEFRAHACRELVVPVLEAALSVTGRRHVGPVGVLLERMAQVAWTWDCARQMFCDVFGEICIWRVSPQELDFRLAFGWQQQVAGRVSSRREFAGLHEMDFALTMQLLRSRPVSDQALLQVALGGTFFTADKLCKFEEGGLPLCRFCGQADSVEHRVWRCPAFEDVRRPLMPPFFPGLGSLLPCQALHAWVPRPARQIELWASLSALPDTSGLFEPWEAAGAVDVFVDGSCLMPESPHLRLAAWSITLARHSPSDPPVILNAGLLPGLLQTSVRAEIFGLLSACRFCRATGAQVRVWCDCLGVVRRATRLLMGSWRVRHNTKNSDLWQLVQDEVGCLAGRLSVQKVTAHVVAEEGHDALMDWLTLNNQDADNAARQAQALRGPLFWELWHAVRRDLALQPLVGRTVHDVHAAVGGVASRRVEKSCTEEPRYWQPTCEHRLVLGGVSARSAVDFVRGYGSAFLEAFDPWCRQLVEAEVTPSRPLRWVSLLQLVVAYLLEVRRRPPFYDGPSKTWYEPDGRIRGQLLQASAAQVAHWFGTTLRAYVRSTGGRYFSKDGRPDSAALQVKMRVVAVPWDNGLAAKVESFLADALPGGVCGGRSRSWANLRI